MPSVTINEKDYTIYNRQLATDNIVYVPGFAITGPIDRPVLLESYRDLIRVFGNTPPATYSPSGSTNATYAMGTSWEYAAGLLNAGFIVLFRRIVPLLDTDGSIEMMGFSEGSGDESSTIPEKLLRRADFTLKYTTKSGDTTSEEKDLFTIKEKLGGTYGNRLKFEILRNASKEKVFYRLTDTNTSTILEYKEVCSIPGTLTSETSYGVGSEFALQNEFDIVKRLYEVLSTSDYITMTYNNDENASKAFAEVIYKKVKKYASGESPNSRVFKALLGSDRSKQSKDADLLGVGTNSYTFIVDGKSGRDFVINDFTLEKTEGSTVAGSIVDTSISTSVASLGSTLMYFLGEIEDKIQYDLKFVTKGCIPIDDRDLLPNDADDSSESFATAVMNFCVARGDCFYPTGPSKGTTPTEILASDDENDGLFSCYNGVGASYVAGYAPWTVMTLFNGYNRWMPPSFTFLYALAKSVSAGNPVYLPPAGVNRMSVPEIAYVEYPVGAKLLSQWQNKDMQINVNPIMKLNNYGYVIYGQRTMYDVSDSVTSYRSALQEVGVRLAIIEIKKKIYNVAVGLTFEYNNIHTWNEFKSQLEPLLIEMQENGALQRYKVIMDNTTTSPDDIDDNIIRGTVKVVPGRAAEDFIISFELYRSSVRFDDEEEVNGY